ncbi:MAG: hypothetical protein H5T64_00075 [Chloroflexi bacterium]|nr:hypothetical protein [Chloroflexota bacterium]
MSDLVLGLGVLLATAILAYLLHRIPWAAALLSAIALVACFILSARVSDENMALYGLQLSVNTLSRAFLLILFGAAAFLALGAGHDQHIAYHGVLLATVAVLAGSILVQDIRLAVILLGVATAVSMLMVQRGGRRAGLAGVYSLLPVPPGVIALLAAFWAAEVFALNPDQLKLPRISTMAAYVGLACLLGVSPLGTGLLSLADVTSPGAITGFLLTRDIGMIYLFLRILALSSLSLEEANALIWMGGLLLSAVSLLASVVRQPGRLVGLSGITDLGVVLLCLAAGTAEGATLAFFHLIVRSAAMALIEAGRGLVGHKKYTTIAKMGLLVGGLTAGGLPLTAGFVARRFIYNRLAGGEKIWLGMLLIASAVTCLAWLWIVFVGLEGEGQGEVPARSTMVMAGAVIALVGLIALLSLQPKILLKPLAGAVETLTIAAFAL